MKTALADISLTSILLVCTQLPNDEQDLIEAITGAEYDASQVAVQAFNSAGPAWTLLIGDTPLAVGGFTRMRPGVARTWMYATSDAWERFGREITVTVRDIVRRMLADGHVHRIETVTLASRFHARQWYETIGLTLESTMPKYCADGQDAVMYVALKQEIT
jgi:hypothetical protein